MAKAKLTSRHYRIIKAAKEPGAVPVDLARRFRMTTPAMRSLLKRLRAKGYDIPTATPQARASGRISTIALAPEVAVALRGIAKRRGVAPRDLAAQIIAAVLRAGSIAALLDGAAP
jgi:hypothetical protein